MITTDPGVGVVSVSWQGTLAWSHLVHNLPPSNGLYYWALPAGLVAAAKESGNGWPSTA
jgi:hypothetical protein